MSLKTNLQLLEIHLPSNFLIYRIIHIKCKKKTTCHNLKLEFIFFLFYLESLGNIPIHFECCIQLPQSRRIHAKVISQMCWCLRKLHARWKLCVSLHAWLFQNKTGRILCQTKASFWWELIAPSPTFPFQNNNDT